MLWVSIPAWAATSTLIPTADAYVQAGSKTAAKNFGTATSLITGTSGTLANNYDSYLKFDTAPVPNITSAKLRLYAAVSKASSIVSTAYPVAVTTWGETTITWNNKPARGTALGNITVASTTYAWYEVDVTAYVQSEFNAGRKVVSFAYHNSANTTPRITAHSKEGVNKPQLLVTYNIAPTVSLTSPLNGSSYNQPANITLSANATDSDGTIAKVEFYDNGTLLGLAVGNSYVWNNVPAGIHQITAKATDNLNTTTTSVAVSITVIPAPALYFIETDHLDTPRQLTDNTGRVVWRWDSTDAFGANLPNEDPDGDGIKTTFNLRMSGQYADKETGTSYNYLRDHYFPELGRYGQSDPIGLRGGLNRFTYVGGNPLRWVDPLGLVVQVCSRPANIAKGSVDHYWVTTDTQSVGLQGDPNVPAGDQYEFIGTPTFPTDHSGDKSTSCEVQNNVDEQCVNSALGGALGQSQGGFGPTSNCKQFAYSTVNKCRTGPQTLPSR